MSNSMGIASAFVLSALILSPLAQAEESPVFAARNQAIAEQAEARFAQQNAPQHDEAQAASNAAESGHADS